MLRRALTYQLILAVAVGPLLCCCAAKVSASSRGHTPAESSAASCCSHKRAPAKSAPADKHAPAKPAEKCPCKDGGGKSQMVQPEPAQATLSILLLALDAVAPFDAPVADAAASESTSRPPGSGARLTTSELLYAHHNLRC